MSKSANLYARVESNVKENAEMILSQLGIPMSNGVCKKTLTNPIKWGYNAYEGSDDKRISIYSKV
jgi:hypothetical protein